MLIYCDNYCNIYHLESEEDFWNIDNGIYRECRGIVLDVENDCIALCPMSKFWNINEREETSLENIKTRINHARTIEFSNKLDGSMQTARWYQNEIIMSGSQGLDPEKSWRIEDGYRLIHLLPGYEKMLKAYPDCTFIFEYISQKDAHVVRYSEDQEGLYLIGVREVKTGRLWDYHSIIAIANQYQIPTTTVFNKTLEQVLSELDDKKSNEAEGFVINIDDYRVKLKYSDYVQAHRVLSAASSPNLVIQCIADGTFDDLISKLPKIYHERVYKTADIVFNYIARTENKIREYYNQAPKNDRKTFMLWMKDNVPQNYRKYCINKYLGQEYNLIKSGNSTQPHYKKLAELME